MEGKSLVDPAVVSDDKGKLYFLEQEYSGLIDDEIREMFGCHLNLPEIPNADCNPVNYAQKCEQQQQGENC